MRISFSLKEMRRRASLRTAKVNVILRDKECITHAYIAVFFKFPAIFVQTSKRKAVDEERPSFIGNMRG